MQSRFELLKKEYERAKGLREKQYISEAEFDKIEAEYRVAEQLRRSEDVQQWQNELNEIEGRMPELLADNLRYGSLTGTGTAATLARLELGLVASSGRVEYLEPVVEKKRKQVARMASLRHQAQEMTDAAELAAAKRQEIEAQLAAVKGLLQSDLELFTVVQPVALAMDGVSSNAKKLVLLGILLSGIVLGFPVLLYDLLKHKEPPLDRAARRLGLPVLARGALLPARRQASDETSRLLALRIQQAAQSPGNVVLFSSMADRAPLSQLLARLSDCLAKRGETAIIVDLSKRYENPYAFASLLKTPPGGNGHPRKRRPPLEGISDYLAQNSRDIGQIVHPTRFTGVDCLLAGTTDMPAEGLATKTLTELFNRLRESYGFVLVAGPITSQAVDLELLAARADGIVFVSPNKGAADSTSEEVVANLLELNAPILGVVG